MSYDSYYRVPDDAIQELINAELSENEAPYDFEYMNALAYFRLSTYATEEEAKRTYREMVRRCQRNENVLSNEIGKINSNYDIIKKYFKHIKWQQNVRDKKVEIQNLMKNAISTENIDRNLEALTNKLKQINNTFYRRIESERTIAGLNYLYNQYIEALREEYKNVLMYYGNIELASNINTLQEFNNFLINLLNKNKTAFLEELDNENNKYQNDESYRPLLKIIINLINESKAQVQSSSFINEKIKEDISTNLRTRINKLKENYLDIEGTLKYLQEFFAEIENHELGTKSKSLLDRLNNLQSEEELNKINDEVEPLEKEAKEYERKKEQEEIDNYIKGLISKYNGLIQNASLEELQELTTKLGKICELISKGKSLNKDLKYYQSIETILDEEKFKISPSGIYIKRKELYSDETMEIYEIYLFHKDVNKFEVISLNPHQRFYLEEERFLDITQEQLVRDYITIEQFMLGAKKILRGPSLNKTDIKPKIFVPSGKIRFYYYAGIMLRLFGVELEAIYKLYVGITQLQKDESKDIPFDKEIEKESPEEIQRIIGMIEKFVKGKSLRKKQLDETKKDSYLDGINPKLYNEIFGVEFNYGNDTSTKPKGGRTRGGNNDLNY